MIINHQHKFIFVKTMKTAGTSLELAFANACGPTDIIAPIRPVEPALANRSDIRFANAKFKHAGKNKQMMIRQHSPLQRAVQALGETIADYAIITSERNPWTKLVSSFFWKLKDSPEQIISDADAPPTDPDELQALFRQFILSPVADPCDAFDMYSHQNVPLADYVIRFEHLADDLAHVVSALSLPETVKLPQIPAKGGIAPNKPALEFDDDMHTMVRARFAREIAAFGYHDQAATGDAYTLPSGALNWRADFWRRAAQKGWQQQ